MLVAVPRLVLARNATRLVNLAILTAAYCATAAGACQMGLRASLDQISAGKLRKRPSGGMVDSRFFDGQQKR